MIQQWRPIGIRGRKHPHRQAHWKSARAGSAKAGAPPLLQLRLVDAPAAADAAAAAASSAALGLYPVEEAPSSSISSRCNLSASAAAY